MKKALVVDDTKNIRNLLTTCLQINDYEVITATNGQEAVDLLRDESFDLVFLDIKMPELSGTSVLKKMREMGIVTPVIIMTAFATVKNAIECTKLGAVAYLQKPFTAEKVKAVLGEIFNHDDSISSLEELIKGGRELIEGGRNTEAYDLLKKALAINPSCAETYYLIGKACEKMGDIRQAEKFYETSRCFNN